MDDAEVLVRFRVYQIKVFKNQLINQFFVCLFGWFLSNMTMQQYIL